MEPAYEFDAPKFWMDFDTVRDGTEGDDDADHWFSKHAELEDDVEAFNFSADGEHNFSNNFIPRPTVKEEPRDGDQEDMATISADSEDIKPVVVKKERDSESGESSVSHPTVKLGRKRSAAIAALKTPIMKQQRVQRDSAKKAAASIHRILKAPAGHHAVTAKTPEHLRRYLAKKQSQVKKTREQLDAEEMDKMQEETKKRLRKYRKSFHRLADSAKKAKVIQLSKPTTESVGFKFRTDRRCRRRAAGSSRPPPHSSGSHPSNFPMTLRSASKNTIEPEVPRKKCTESKPFNFRLDSRLTTRDARKKEEEEEERKKNGYVSTAEYIFKFQTETPERFRTTSRKSHRSMSAATVNESMQSGKAVCGSVTMPYTPKLQTKVRARPAIVKSSAELEEEELSKIRSNPFRPHPLNPKVFSEQGLLGVPRKLHHPLTQPHTPKLATRERGEARNDTSEDSEEDNHVPFKAQPLPKGIFDKVLGLPKKHQLPPTCPESPAFALKRRKLHRSDDEDEDQEKCHIIIAQPVPDFSHKFEPQLSHKRTEPKPFAFEERYKDKPARETLVQQILQKEKTQPFKANPVPDFDGPILPAVMQPPLTDAKTPTLQTKARGKVHESKWRQKLDEMAQKAKETAEFRAKDAKVLYKPPFTTAKTELPMTEVSNFVLHTEIRSDQRAKYNAEMEHKELQREQENRERQALAEAEAAKKVASLRRSMVHNALPVHHYAPTVILPSSKPLTAAHSPNFHIKLRGLH